MTQPTRDTHIARKRFGQNFLHDPGIIHKIARAIHPLRTDHLVEIGPGQGALTRELIDRCQHYSALELDRDLIAPLQAEWQHLPHFHLYNTDALTFDYSSLQPRPLRIIGNLPYNISAPLLVHLMSYAEHIQDLHVMVQQEMAERISAAPDGGDYGRLSVLLQYYCQVETLFNVPPQVFRPIPKVNSQVIRLTPYRVKPHTVKDIKRFETLLRDAFSQRRKTISNTLKPHFSKEQLLALDIDPQQRAENLSVEEYVKLSNHDLT